MAPMVVLLEQASMTSDDSTRGAPHRLAALASRVLLHFVKRPNDGDPAGRGGRAAETPSPFVWPQPALQLHSEIEPDRRVINATISPRFADGGDSNHWVGPHIWLRRLGGRVRPRPLIPSAY